MTQAKQKAVIYCRVSSRAQETLGHGLESQETRCRQHAEYKGYEVAGVFPDTFTGGGDFMARPGMKALLSFLDAQPNERFVVIFDDLKRFARDLEFHIKLRREMDARGATRECLNFDFNDTPESDLQEMILAVAGEYERKSNGRQVAQKMKARMESGYWLHAAPAGYKYETQRGHGKILVFDEPLASIVREVFEGYATGRFATQSEVRRFLDAQPTFPRNGKGQITQQRVTDILGNPLYTGHICSETYGINWLKGHHPPLISIETFDKVQQRRANPPNAPKRANVGDDFALRGIATCAGCDVPLRSSWAKGNTKRYAYYLCQTKGCDHYGKSIARDKIEGEVGDLLKSLQPTPGLISLAKAMFRHAWDQRLAQAKDAQEVAKAQLRTLDKQIESVLDRILGASNATVIATYEKEIGDLEKEKARLGGILDQQDDPDGSFDEKLEPVLAFLANPWKLWETGQTNLRTLVLKLTFPGRIHYDRNKGARTPEIAFPFKVLEGIQDPRVCFGAPTRTRTADLLITNQLLYQLSYRGTVGQI